MRHLEEQALRLRQNWRPTTRLSRFYRLPIADRRQLLADSLEVCPSVFEDLGAVWDPNLERADRTVENVIGLCQLPLGVCLHLRVDGSDRVVPMATEEPSVIAAASHAARLLRTDRGLVASVSEPIMEGQIQLLDVPGEGRATRAIRDAADELLARANDAHPRLVAAGGGARELSARPLPAPASHDSDSCPDMLIVKIAVDVREAMGANVVNSMCEQLAPEIERLTGGRAHLRILTNLCHRRTVTIKGRVPSTVLGRGRADRGLALAQGIVEASLFAERDPERAATHNKGIFNGVDAVLLAFGQDWRAVEAGAHAYAARDGTYGPLSHWRLEGHLLVGELTMPLAVGTIGGTLEARPAVQACFQVAKIAGAADLASLAGAVGLAQNLAALRALAGEGIQAGHLRLHARHICADIGADGEEAEQLAPLLAARRITTPEPARELLSSLRANAAGGTSRGARARPRLEDDARYCAEVIRRVSRTFSLSIEALPNELRVPIRIAYLLCRIVDTIEDEPRIDERLRRGLFDAFEHQLLDDSGTPDELERACAALEGATGAEQDLELCRHAGAVLRCFRGLPRAERAIIRPRVLAMSQGMWPYCRELDREGRLVMADIEMLERYCYYVAGTVGELLTGMFERHVGELELSVRSAIHSRAVPFGLGLQMVNVLKDVCEDAARGVCFVPRSILQRHHLTLEALLEEESRPRALAAVREVAHRAREHLGRASEYTALWPGERAEPVRLFCAVPLALAYATLREIEDGDDTLRAGRSPKVSRECMRDIVERAAAAAASPEDFATFISAYAR